MPVMQCVACGMEARPKSYHPSSLRVETGVWLVAVLVGLIVGVSQTVESPGAERERSVTALAAVATPPADVQPARTPADYTTGSSPAVQVSTWIRGKIALFLRSAWWVLPIPILFSLWRQMSKRVGCPKCGSRELIPAPEEAW